MLRRCHLNHWPWKLTHPRSPTLDHINSANINDPWTTLQISTHNLFLSFFSPFLFLWDRRTHHWSACFFDLWNDEEHFTVQSSCVLKWGALLYRYPPEYPTISLCFLFPFSTTTPFLSCSYNITTTPSSTRPSLFELETHAPSKCRMLDAHNW